MGFRQQPHSQSDDDHGDRQVDDKEPLPNRESHDDAAQDWANQEGQPKNRPDQTERAAAFFGRE